MTTPGWARLPVIVAVSAGIALGVGYGLSDLKTDLVFFAFVFLGELLGISLPGGHTAAISLAVSFGFVLLPSGAGWGDIALVVMGGGFAASLVRRRGLRWRSMVESSRRSLVLLATVGLVEGALGRITILPMGPQRLSVLTMGGALAFFVLADTLWRAALEALPRRIPLWPVWIGTLRALGSLYAALGALGSLIALSYPALGIWCLGLFLVPLIATQYSFGRFAWIRNTYLQTVRALSRVPEMGGYSEPGHTRRVAELCLEVARDLGMSSVDNLEYAALMHDLGRLSLTDPPPPAIMATSDQRRELARVGAEVVGKTGYLEEVAHLVRQSAEPYRQPWEDDDSAVPLGSRIIKTVSAFDDLVRPGGPGLTARDALERLHLGMAYEHDPRVVRSLTRVLEKRDWR